MLFHHFILSASAILLPLVNGRDDIFEPEQDVFSESDGRTITLQTEARASRMADFAIVNVAVTGFGDDENAARRQGFDLADDVEMELIWIQQTNPGPIRSWKRSEMRQHTHDHPVDRYGSDCRDSPNRFDMTTLFSIRFDELYYFQDLMREITANPGASTKSIIWELNEQSFANLKDKLGAEAYFKLVANAEDYAKTVGGTDVQALECHESYSFVGEEVGSSNWPVGSINDSPQEVEVETRQKCKFSIT